MKSQFDIAKSLVKVGAFQEKNPPVLGTSGLPLFYFVNTEKLLCDHGKWIEFGDDSADMGRHVLNCYKNKAFKEPIDYLVQQIVTIIKELDNPNLIVSGFQRRDWPFSIIVAFLLKIKHLSLYKNGRIEILNLHKNKIEIEKNPVVKNIQTIHVSDLMTTGSSVFSGWYPMMQRYNIKVRYLVNIVSRMQGGEEKLQSLKIPNKALVKIDEDFLLNNAQYPDLCIEYKKNTKKTIIQYLEQNGAQSFLSFFNPQLGETGLKRTKLFCEHWLQYLNTKQLHELDKSIKAEYNMSREEIFYMV